MINETNNIKLVNQGVRGILEVDSNNLLKLIESCDANLNSILDYAKLKPILEKFEIDGYSYDGYLLNENSLEEAVRNGFKKEYLYEKDNKVYALCLKDEGVIPNIKYVYDDNNLYEAKFLPNVFSWGDIEEEYSSKEIHAEYCSKLNEDFFFEVNLDSKKSVALTFDKFNYGYVDENKIFDNIAVIKPVI